MELKRKKIIIKFFAIVVLIFFFALHIVAIAVGFYSTQNDIGKEFC